MAQMIKVLCGGAHVSVPADMLLMKVASGTVRINIVGVGNTDVVYASAADAIVGMNAINAAINNIDLTSY